MELTRAWGEEELIYSEERADAAFYEIYYSVDGHDFQAKYLKLSGDIIQLEILEVDGDFQYVYYTQLPANCKLGDLKELVQSVVATYLGAGGTGSGTKISVTQSDIDGATPKDPCRCAVAAAIARQCKDVESVFVKPEVVDINYYNKHPETFNLPEKALDFIFLFDRGQQVQPFTFNLGELI